MCDVLAFLAPDGRLDKGEFLSQWKGIAAEQRHEVSGLPPSAENVEGVCPKLEAANIFFIARRKLPDGADLVYFSVKAQNATVMLAELGFRPGSGSCTVTMKSTNSTYRTALLSRRRRRRRRRTSLTPRAPPAAGTRCPSPKRSRACCGPRSCACKSVEGKNPTVDLYPNSE